MVILINTEITYFTLTLFERKPEPIYFPEKIIGPGF